MWRVSALAFALAGCGTRTPLDLGPGSDADGGDADMDADVDADVDADADADADAPSCEDICFRVDFCGLGHLPECLDDCALLEDAWAPDAFAAIFGGCIEEPCDQIEACADDVQASIEPDDLHRDFCRQTCARLDLCNMDDGSCMASCLDPTEDPPYVMLSEAFLDDLEHCLEGSCDALEECVVEVTDRWLPES